MSTAFRTSRIYLRQPAADSRTATPAPVGLQIRLDRVVTRNVSIGSDGSAAVPHEIVIAETEAALAKIYGILILLWLIR